MVSPTETREMQKRHDLAVVTVLSLFGFGIGHMKTGAPLRGLGLLCLQLFAILGAIFLKPIYLPLGLLAVGLDLVGSRARVDHIEARRVQRALPEARLRIHTGA